MPESLSDKKLRQEISHLEKELAKMKRAHTTLKKKEKILRSLIKYSSLGIVTVDRNMLITACNPVFEKIFQFKRKELLGKNLDEIIARPHSLQEAQAYSKHTLTGKSIRRKGRRYRKDGTPITVEFFAVPAIVDGEIVGAYGLYEDVSEKESIKKRLQESEARYRQLVEASPLPITVYDNEKLYFANAAAFRTFQAQSPDDFSGKEVLDFAHPDSRELIQKRMKRLLQGKSLPVAYEKLLTLRGKMFEAEVHSVPVSYQGRPAIMSVFLDITEKRESETRLKKEEERYRILYEESKRQEELYRSLLNSSADAIIIYNLKGETEYVSPSFTKMFGWTFEEVKGKRIPFVPEEERDPSLKVIHALLENGNPVRGFETRRLTKDGRVLNISISASRYNDHTGKPAGILVVLRDITGNILARQKIIEEENRYRELYNETKRQEEMYRSLLKSSADAIIIYTLQGEAEFVSPSFTKMFGWTFEEVKGKQIPFVPKDEEEPTRAAIHKLFTERKPITNFETKRLTKDGRLLHISVSGSLFDDAQGNPAGVLVVLRDTTERVKAEEAIHRSERRFRELYDSVSDLIFTLDLNGYFLSANRAVTELTGYTVSEFRGKRPSDFMKPEYRELFDSEYLVNVKARGYHHGISTYLTKDGRQIYVEHRSTLVRPDNGEAYISAISRDVTERVLTEKRIKRLQEEMLQAQKMEAIGTLAGGIAHDFNNILMGIQGNISLMKLHTPEGSPEHKRLQSMEEYIQSGSELTTQLLGFARGGRYEVKPTDMNILIEKQVRLFGRAKKEIVFHVKYQDNLWAIEGDQGQLEQVLLNLLVNAWQAMPGGGHLFIQTENRTLDAQTSETLSLPPGRYVSVSVTDTGIGMDKETVKRIFEPFFSTKEKGRGTGLGLASVYGIIKNHGGAISVESAPKKGSTFTFYLPATEKPVKEKEERDPEGFVPGKGRVMLIDDEKKILEVGRQLLEALGYEVVTFHQGQAAVETFKREGGHFDLVILDMIMPGMGGQDVFRALRKIDPRVRILLASGYSIDGEASKIMDMGCNGFIQKPFSVEKLSKKIQEVLKAP